MANVSKVLQCALVVLSLATSGISLHFASNLHEVCVNIGNSINLQCILGGDSSDGGSFSWRGPAVNSDRAVITLDISGTVSTLTIGNVSQSDEGRYFCRYSGVGEVSILLDVQLPPHFLNVSEYQEFIEGTDAAVECPAFFGDPQGNMTWTRDNALIINDRFTLEDGQMRIQNIQENDEGVYRCSINHLGIIDSRFITVDVLERSELAPRIVEPMSPIEVVYREPLDLTCQLEVQRDDVHYTWTVDTNFEDNHFKNTTPTLHRDAYQFLGGRYTCKAENEYGYDEQVFYVRILAPPEPAICSEQEETRNEGETVVLEHCSITSPVQLSELHFQWSRRNGDRVWVKIRPGRQFSVNHDGFLTISDVQPSDSGLYQVNISNSQGYALHSVQFEVTPASDVPISTLRLRFELSGSGDSDGSCQEIQEMKDAFTEALLKAICGRLEACSEESDIGLRESTIICPTSDSKIGTFSAILNGTNAAKMVESIEQVSEELSVALGRGLTLTLSACDDHCPTAMVELIGQAQSSGLVPVAGVVISVILLAVTVIAAAIMLTVIVFKYNKQTHHIEPNTTLPSTGETYAEHSDILQQHQLNVNIEYSCKSELDYTGSSCSELASVQDSSTSDDQMLLNKRTNQVWQHNADHDQGYCSTSDQSLDSVPVFQSRYFTEAGKSAQVPFVFHQFVVCDCSDREYTIANHDITLKIPEGAVPEGQTIHFEVAVAMYGPFTFPNNTQPISPILWLCIMEEDVELKKPFKVVLPHFLAGLTRDQLLHYQACFAKASHYKYIPKNEHIYYEFLPSEDKSGFAFNGCRGYGVLETNHCCFYCLLAKKTPEVAKDAGYCLARIESSLTLQRSEVFFTAIYFLDSCLKSLEEQFPSEEGYRICRYDDFKFKDNESGEPHIKVVAPSEHNQCVIGMEPMTAEIRASDIDFWRKGFEDMRRRHQRKMYPPRVKMTVSLRNPDITLKLPVKFTGCLSDSQLDVELTFPLGEKPKLKDVFKELLPQATEWKTIGTLLGVEEHVLDKIKCDEEGTRDRLQKMLSEWLKQADPLPTWKELAEAMEAVDVLKAKELRARSADIA